MGLLELNTLPRYRPRRARFSDFCLDWSVGRLNVALTRLCGAVTIEGGSRQTHRETRSGLRDLLGSPFQGGKHVQGGWLSGVGHRGRQPRMKGSKRGEKRRKGKRKGPVSYCKASSGSSFRTGALEAECLGPNAVPTPSSHRDLVEMCPAARGTRVLSCEVWIIMVPSSGFYCLPSCPASDVQLGLNMHHLLS